MGSDYTLIIFDAARFEKKNLKSRRERYQPILDSNLTDDEIGWLKRTQVDVLDDLLKIHRNLNQDEPNVIDIEEIFLRMGSAVTHDFTNINSFSFLGSRFRRVPDALEEYSEEAANQWRKLLRRKSSKSDEPLKFELGKKSYTITESEMGGFIQGEEIEEFCNAIEPIVRNHKDIYENLNGEHRKRLRRQSPVELLYGLAKFYSNSYAQKPVFMVYHSF
ncbi:MAG: hypothetical protein R6V35_03210 [Candidatus Nanohaloarchaea archaeon]